MASEKHDIYLRAAKLAAGDPWMHESGACCLIAEAAGEGMRMYKSNVQSAAFAKMFKPKKEAGPFWLDDYTIGMDEIRERRIIALLFAHLMHLDGQLP